MGAEGAYTHRFKDDDDEGADVAAVGHLRIRRGCLRDARYWLVLSDGVEG